MASDIGTDAKQAHKGNLRPTEGFVVVGGTAIKGMVPVAYQNPRVLGVLQEIIRRESGGDPIAKNSNSTAYGLCQFIDGTWAYVQEKWGMQLNRYSPEDQLYACERLFIEEGLKHWEQSFPRNEFGPYQHLW